MYFDGSVMKTGAGAGLLFISPIGVHMRYMVRLHFPASNNTAEYEALLSGLRITIELDIKRLDVRGDSQLVIDQVMKESSCHDLKMEAYCNAVRRLEDKFDDLELNHVPRKYNKDANELAKIASGRTTVPQNIFARDLAKPSIDFKDPTEPGTSSAKPSVGKPSAGEYETMEKETETTSAAEAEAMQIDEALFLRDWRDQYLDWINQGVLPSDRAQARRIARRAMSFALIDRELYKRSPSRVLQCCILIPEGRELLRDIHAGACGRHAAPRTLMGTHSGRAFTGPQQSPTPQRSCGLARAASYMPVRRTFQLMLCKSSPLHGLLPYGGWTSSDHCRKRPGASPTCWWQSISSPSGSRHDPSPGSNPSRPCSSSPT